MFQKFFNPKSKTFPTETNINKRPKNISRKAFVKFYGYIFSHNGLQNRM